MANFRWMSVCGTENSKTGLLPVHYKKAPRVLILFVAFVANGLEKTDKAGNFSVSQGMKRKRNYNGTDDELF